MFKYFLVDGKEKSIVAMFKYNKDKTQGVILDYIDSKRTVENKRITKLIHKKESD